MIGKKRPWGQAYSVIDRPGRNDDEEAQADWISLGPVWESDRGALVFVLRSEPLAWRNPQFVRRVVLTRSRESD